MVRTNLDAHTRTCTHAHKPNCHCDKYVLLTASGLDKKILLGKNKMLVVRGVIKGHHYVNPVFLNPFPHNPDLNKEAFSKIVKEEKAGKQLFLLFPQHFLPFPIEFSIFQSYLLCHLYLFSFWISLKIIMW